MEIEEYFKSLEDKKTEMETAYKNYIEHIHLKCDISGISYKEIMVKGSMIPKGLDSKIEDDEFFANEYRDKYNEFKTEREKCLIDINKLKSKLHRLIIEYSFINKESIKELCLSLKKYHRMDYVESTLLKEKSKAKKEFKNIIKYQ